VTDSPVKSRVPPGSNTSGSQYPAGGLRHKTFSWLPARNLLRYALANTGKMSFYDKLKFDASGLIPAIMQEQGTGRVLMMAWMNRASLEKTIATRKTHFWSRSRQKFWMKGESSGHTQTVKNIAFDCDGDTLLVQVDQIGAACHEGYKSCFFRSVESDGAAFKVTEPQLETPEHIYGKK
jgi:phosphoribosyl-AMP cyclohydrolase